MKKISVRLLLSSLVLLAAVFSSCSKKSGGKARASNVEGKIFSDSYVSFAFTGCGVVSYIDPDSEYETIGIFTEGEEGIKCLFEGSNTWQDFEYDPKGNALVSRGGNLAADGRSFKFQKNLETKTPVTGLKISSYISSSYRSYSFYPCGICKYFFGADGFSETHFGLNFYKPETSEIGDYKWNQKEKCFEGLDTTVENLDTKKSPVAGRKFYPAQSDSEDAYFWFGDCEIAAYVDGTDLTLYTYTQKDDEFTLLRAELNDDHYGIPFYYYAEGNSIMLGESYFVDKKAAASTAKEEKKSPAKQDSGSGKTLSVNTGNSKDYSSIAAALENANDGDKILIGSGTYTENLDITKPVAFEGKEGEQVIIQGEGTFVKINAISSGVVSFFNITFKNTGSKKTLEKDTDTPEDANGLITCSGSALFGNCTVSNAAEYGILVNGGAGTTVFLSNCKVETSAYYGVKVCGASNLNVEECTFTGNISSGLAVEDDGTYAKITDSKFIGNGHSAVFNQNANSEFTNCELSESEYSGMSIEGGTVELNNCKVVGNTYHALSISRGSDVTVDDSIFDGNKTSQLYAEGPETTVSFTDTKFTAGEQIAIRLTKGVEGYFSSCTASGNKGGVLNVDADCPVTFDDCDGFGVYDLDGYWSAYPTVFYTIRLDDGKFSLVEEGSTYDSGKFGVKYNPNGTFTISSIDWTNARFVNEGTVSVNGVNWSRVN